MSRLAACFIFAVAGCGGSDTPTVDAPASANVAAVDCASHAPTQTIMATGGDTDGKFMPMSVTITKGQVVEFVTTSIHNVVPNAGTDAALTVGFSATKCFQFNVAGTFAFHCGPHGFQGSVVVN